MTVENASLLLAVLGSTALLAAWFARRSGDAPRDIRLMASIGAGLLAVAAGTWAA